MKVPLLEVRDRQRASRAPIILPVWHQRRGMSEIPTGLWTPEGFLVADEDGEFRPYDAFKAVEDEYHFKNGVRMVFGPDGEWHWPRIRGGSTAVAYRVVQGTSFALTAGAKTANNAIAPAGFGMVMTEFSVSFDGVTATAVPALVEVVRSTQATAGTSGVTPTITQNRGRATSSTAPTGGSNYTAEPTVLTSMSRWFLPQFMGAQTFQSPLAREIVECDSSGGTNKAFGIRINVSANVNQTGHIEAEPTG